MSTEKRFKIAVAIVVSLAFSAVLWMVLAACVMHHEVTEFVLLKQHWSMWSISNTYYIDGTKINTTNKRVRVLWYNLAESQADGYFKNVIPFDFAVLHYRKMWQTRHGDTLIVSGIDAISPLKKIDGVWLEAP